MAFHDAKHDSKLSSAEEDSILSNLRIYALDGIGIASCTTFFVKVTSLREFRITADSDTDLKLRLEWSMDGEKVDSYTEYSIQADVCFTKQVDVVLQYVRFNIPESEDEKQNCRLKILAFSPEDKSSKIATTKEHRKSIFSSAKSFSPKASPKSKKRDESPGGGIKNDRLPTNIFKGSLLVGKNIKELTILPKGNNGDCLVMIDGTPQWVSVLTLFSMYDEAQKKEREKFTRQTSPAPTRPVPPLPAIPRSKSVLSEPQMEMAIDEDETVDEEVGGIYDISVNAVNSDRPENKKKNSNLSFRSIVSPLPSLSSPFNSSSSSSNFNYNKKPLPLPPAFQ